MKKIALLLIMPLLATAFGATALFAEDEEGITTSSELFLQLSTLPEAKLGFRYSFNIPFLQGSSPLTEGNNIDISLGADVTPISFDCLVDITWTPIAFLEFAAGGRVGSGWNTELFGGDIYGIGINQLHNPGVADGKAFDGVLWGAYIGGAFQFDFAALFPGDWNHVIFRTYHEINYAGYTRAEKNEAWFLENDAGENMNGFNYYGNIVVGYQMPIFLNFIGLMAEMDLYLYDTPGRTEWGDDLIRWTFSWIMNFAITEQLGIALITQFETTRNFTEANWENLHYQERSLNKSNPLSFEFYRVAAIITYSF